MFSEGNAPYIKSGGGGSVRFLMVVGMLHKGMRLEGGGDRFKGLSRGKKGEMLFPKKKLVD